MTRAATRRTSDAFGQALLDWVRGSQEPEVIERRDGVVEVGAGPEVYLADVADWPAAERAAVDLATGRVADLGCGAGRVALHLQTIGRDVTALDWSPHAVRAAQLHGVAAVRRRSLEQYSGEIAGFDTTILFGNNLGLFGTPARLRRVLTAWRRDAPENARILVESTDPLSGGAPIVDRAYCRENVDRGRTAGQCRLRVWYDRRCTAWFDWFFMTPTALRAAIRGTGWRVVDVVAASRDEPFVAVVERWPE